MRYFNDSDRDLTGQRIGSERMCVVGHKEAARSNDDARQPRWIGFPPTRTSKDDFGRLLRRRLAVAGLDDTDVMSVDSLSAQKRLVEVGLGMALVPESSVRE